MKSRITCFPLTTLDFICNQAAISVDTFLPYLGETWEIQGMERGCTSTHPSMYLFLMSLLDTEHCALENRC